MSANMNDTLHDFRINGTAFHLDPQVSASDMNVVNCAGDALAGAEDRTDSLKKRVKSGSILTMDFFYPTWASDG